MNKIAGEVTKQIEYAPLMPLSCFNLIDIMKNQRDSSHAPKMNKGKSDISHGEDKVSVDQEASNTEDGQTKDGQSSYANNLNDTINQQIDLDKNEQHSDNNVAESSVNDINTEKSSSNEVNTHTEL